MARRAAQAGPQGGRAGRGAVPEPAPGAGDRPGVPGQRLLRRPGRGAGQVRDGAQGQGRRRPGHRGRRGVRVLPARRTTPRPPRWSASGLEGLVPGPARAARRHKLTEEILAWAEEQLAADPALRPAQLPGLIEDAFGVRVHPRSVERALARRRERHSKSR